jgi:hypothetical protein
MTRERAAVTRSSVDIVVDPRTIATALLVIVAILTMTGLAARAALYLWPDVQLVQPLRVFDVGEERSIPTWFQATMFALAALLLVAIAAATRRRAEPQAAHWGALAGFVAFLSLDEVATLHETLGATLKRLLEASAGIAPGGAFSYFWVVPGLVVVALAVALFARFVSGLPQQTRRLMLLAGMLFVAGAFGLEMLSAEILSLAGGDAAEAARSTRIALGLLTSAEELLEMLSGVVLTYALLTHLRDQVGFISLRFSDGDAPTP